MLSIYVLTYNHEKYIAKALDSILMQKTKYSYEILVGEDCSTDGTRKVLETYEKKYPGKFQMFYREKNMYGQIPSNASDLRSRCKGKYVIALEGDDYWLDEYKLEKQIKFLEEHPEYIGVAHNCTVVDENSEEWDRKYPECKDEEYTIKHYVSEIMPGQLATLMYRNIIKDDSVDTSLFEKGLTPGDRLTYFALVLNGKVKCVQEIMSAYRLVRPGGSSFTRNYRYDFVVTEKFNWGLVEYSRKINSKEGIKYSELLYFKNLMNGIAYKQCGFRDVLKHMKNIEHKITTVFLYTTYWFRKNILHQTLWV